MQTISKDQIIYLFFINRTLCSHVHCTYIARMFVDDGRAMEGQW